MTKTQPGAWNWNGMTWGIQQDTTTALSAVNLWHKVT